MMLVTLWRHTGCSRLRVFIVILRVPTLILSLFPSCEVRGAFKVSLIVYWYVLRIKNPSFCLFEPMCSLLPLSDSFVSQEFLVSSKLFLKFGLFLVTWFWPVPLRRIRLHVWIYILFLTHAYNKYPEPTAPSILDMLSVTLEHRTTAFSLLLHPGLHRFNAGNKSHPSLLTNLPPFIHSFIFYAHTHVCWPNI